MQIEDVQGQQPLRHVRKDSPDRRKWNQGLPDNSNEEWMSYWGPVWNRSQGIQQVQPNIVQPQVLQQHTVQAQQPQGQQGYSDENWKAQQSQGQRMMMGSGMTQVPIQQQSQPVQPHQFQATSSQSSGVGGVQRPANVGMTQFGRRCQWNRCEISWKLGRDSRSIKNGRQVRTKNVTTKVVGELIIMNQRQSRISKKEGDTVSQLNNSRQFC